MDYGLFGVRFLFLGIKGSHCSIDDFLSILQRPLLFVYIGKNQVFYRIHE